MNKHKQKIKPDGWGALFRTIGKLRLPWIWIIIGLSINLLLNSVMLKLPDTTADLLSGQLTGHALMEAVMYYVMFGLLNTVAVASQVQAQSYSVKRTRESIWKKMLGMKMEYFDKNDPTDMMSAVINDAGSAVLDFVNIIIYLLPDIYYIVLAIKRINEYHWILAISCLAMIPIKYLYAWIMGRQFQKNSAVLYGNIGILTGFLADRISHLPLIKTYVNEEKETKNGEKAAHEILKTNMKIVRLDNVAQAAVSVIDILQKFVVVVVAVILIQKGEIDIAMWLAFFLFSQNLFPYLDQIFELWVRAKTVHGTFHRIIDIMDGPDEENDAKEEYPEEGDIVFDNITFTYPQTDTPALKNVTFTVPRNSAVAIVGLCGSGKTTTVSLFERFYEAESGNIYIGKTNIKDISLKDFRKNLAYVQQGADIFGGTIREVVTYGIDRELSDEEIIKAAEMTGFIDYLNLCEAGLDTEIASGKESMSGGQSQRLVLTREVLKGGDIVIMDEPTAALDVRVSVKIQETMDKVFADKTRILITHDLAYAKRYDRILVMYDGELVGDGNHETLLKTCEMYRKMNENTKEEMAYEE